MKKHIFILALFGILILNFNSLKAQDRPEGRPPKEHVETLTTTQIELVNKILSDYNSESFSANDAKAIIKALMGAEIPPGKGVEDAITSAGFDFEKLKRLAPPPTKPGSNPGNNSENKPGNKSGNKPGNGPERNPEINR